MLTIGKPVPPVEYVLGWHLPVLLAIPVAVVVVVALAAVIGSIALRNLREIYFAVTTLAAVYALYLVVENYTPLFDGYNGVYGLINPGQTALRLTYDGYRIVLLALVLVLLFLAYLLVQRLSRSPYGRMLRSVRDAPDTATAQRVIADALPPLLASVLAPEQLELMRQKLSRLPEPPARPRITRADALGVPFLCSSAVLDALTGARVLKRGWTMMVRVAAWVVL